MESSLVRRIDALVLAALSSTWPTTEDERIGWEESLGLPTTGKAKQDEPLGSRAESVWTEWDGMPFGWSRFDGEFVGIFGFVYPQASEDLASDAAELRREWVSRWGDGSASSDDPVMGWMNQWRVGEHVLDAYWHAPREFHGHSVSPCLQLHLDHAARHDALEAAHRAAARQRDAGLSAD